MQRMDDISWQGGLLCLSCHSANVGQVQQQVLIISYKKAQGSAVTFKRPMLVKLIPRKIQLCVPYTVTPNPVVSRLMSSAEPLCFVPVCVCCQVALSGRPLWRFYLDLYRVRGGSRWHLCPFVHLCHSPIPGLNESTLQFSLNCLILFFLF